MNPEIKFFIKSNSEKILDFTFCDSNITSNINAYLISFVSNHHDMTFFKVKYHVMIQNHFKRSLVSVYNWFRITFSQDGIKNNYIVGKITYLTTDKQKDVINKDIE